VRTDLDELPDEVRRTAVIFANGEVAWPNDHARKAIDALAAAGKRILGLDARTLYDNGGIMEVPISSGIGRDAALAALPSAVAEGTHVLITWE
jgi:hypothetical protein